MAAAGSTTSSSAAGDALHPAFNKVAIVTGAGGTLGEAFVRALLADSWKVVAVEVREVALESLVTRTDAGEDQLMPMAVDITNGEEVEVCCRRVVNKWGAISALINNAGILSNNKCAETTEKEWDRVMNVNVKGSYLFAHHILPIMRSQKFGRIINICSMAAKTGGVTAGTAYSTSKGALQSLTFSLARETCRQGITVNGIAPAYVRTPMVTEKLTPEQQQEVMSAIPVGRFCEPEEVAHAVMFLVSPLAGFITGEIIDQNGGYHMD